MQDASADWCNYARLYTGSAITIILHDSAMQSRGICRK